MVYLLLKQGGKKKYLECKNCGFDFFTASDMKNQNQIGASFLSVKAICSKCGETSSWRFTNAIVEEHKSKDIATNYGNTTPCDECTEIAYFIPPPKTIGKELIVSYRCKNNHITVCKYTLK